MRAIISICILIVFLAGLFGCGSKDNITSYESPVIEVSTSPVIEMSTSPETSSVTPTANNNDDDAVLEKIYGKWKVVKNITPPGVVTDKTPEDVDKMMGQIVIYSEDQVIGKDRNIVPDYEMSYVTPSDFHNGFNIFPEQVGINDSEVLVISVYKAGKHDVWSDIGGWVVLKDDNTLVSCCPGIFLELKRVDE